MQLSPPVKRVTLGGFSLAFLLTGAHAMNDAFANILPVFLPTLQARFGLGEAALAGFVALISFSSNVLQAPAGALADRWGRRRVAAAGLIAGSVLMSFIPIVPSLAGLVLILAIGGLGSAVFHPAAAAMARDVGERKGLAVGLFGSGGPFGAAVMPIVALFMLREFGPHTIPWLALLGVALGVALFWFSPQQTRPSRATRPKIFDPKLFFGPVGVLAFVGILRATAYISFLNALPLYLVSVRGYATDAPIIGYALAVYQVAASAGMMLAGALELRLGRRPLVVGSMLLAFPALIATLFVTPGTAAFYATVFVAGLATNGSIPLLVVSAQDLAPNAVASATGMLMGFTWGTAGVLYIGMGALQETLGLTVAMIIGFAALVPSALVAARVVPPKTKTVA
jgi:FSR family fosmidomycin resistance protein-like MFS transporter